MVQYSLSQLRRASAGLWASVSPSVSLSTSRPFWTRVARGSSIWRRAWGECSSSLLEWRLKLKSTWFHLRSLSSPSSPNRHGPANTIHKEGAKAMVRPTCRTVISTRETWQTIWDMEAVHICGLMAKCTAASTSMALRMDWESRRIRTEAATQANSSMGESMA